MNHVYKVIWSNAKSCYIVVSELAKNRSKNTVKVLSTLLAILGLGCSTFMDYNLLQKVDAAPITEKYQVETGKVENDTGKNDEGEDITSKGAMAIGKDSSVTRLDPEAPVSSTNNANESMAIGNGAIVQGQGSMAIGTGASVIANTALALGIESQVTGSNGLALGNKTTAGEGSIAIGNGGQVISQNHGIAIGMSSKSYSMNGIAIGLLSQTTDTYKDDNRNAGAIAIGSQARALGDVSIALGQNSEVSKNVAQSIAIGPSTKVSGDYAVALGTISTVSGDYGIAIGRESESDASQGIAIGRKSKVSTGAINSVAIGYYSSVNENAQQGIAIGYYTGVNAEKGTAVGSWANVNGSFSTAMGYNSQTFGQQSLAIGGYQAVANAKYSTAVGSWANVAADAEYGLAMGYNTKVNVEQGVALGSSSVANVAKGVTGWSPEALSEAEQKSSTWTSTAGAVSVGDSDNGITRQITNVAAGTEDTDAVNVAQLKQAITSSVDDVALSFKGDDGTEIEKKNGETLEIVGGAPKDKLTEDNIGVVEEDGKLNIKLSENINLGPSGSMIIGNSIMNNNGITINSGSGGSPIIINQGNVSMGGNVIHDVAPGVADTDAVNMSQLKDYVSSNTSLSFKGDAGNEIEKNSGETLEIVGGAQGALTEGNIGVVEENGKLNIKLSQDIDLGNDGSISIGDISIENNNVSMGGNVIHNVAAGVADTDAVNVSQLKELESKVSAHNTVSTGDKNLTITETKNNDGGTNYDLALNPDLVVDSVTTGDTVMNDDGLTVGNDISITENNVTVGDVKIDVDNGIDAGDHKITNVSDGEISSDSKDAVNGSQLYATNQKIDNITQNVNNISNRVNKLDGRINKVGAGAAALAALHPLDFDPDEKLTFSAGIGNYRGETAGAIGAFYRPDEKVMFSIGGTVGNGENMVNAGVSFALDRVSHVNDSKVAMAKEIIDLRSQVAELSQLVNQLAVQRGILTDATKLFPDVPENHWAYEYIGKLAAAGIIEGYPNGRFDGDRMMTRYEFAAMLYRALEKGVQLDARIVKEFAAELGRIRVDRISGEDDEEDKVERVRVNFDDKPRDHYGSEIPAPEQE